jgi:hypothetical protein
MTRADLDEFVKCYNPENRHERKQRWSEKKNAEGPWRAFTYEELLARDKCSFDLLPSPRLADQVTYSQRPSATRFRTTTGSNRLADLPVNLQQELEKPSIS